MRPAVAALVLSLWLGCGGGLGRPASEAEVWGGEGPCGNGTWRPGFLEVHHIDVGQGDATLIVGPTGRTLLIDAGEPYWSGHAGARLIGETLRRVMGCSRLDQVLLTHFHVDHVGFPGKGGLWHLVEVQGIAVAKTLHRDLRGYAGRTSGTLHAWQEYLDGGGRDRLRPELAREGPGQIDLGPGVTFSIVAVDGNGALHKGDFSADASPPSENDYSVAALLRFGRLDYFIAGDLSGHHRRSPFGFSYHDIEVTLAHELPDVDVYRVSHHGSAHSSSPTLLAQIDPEVSIVSVGDSNPFGHPSQEVVDGLLATSALYLTERGHSGTRLRAARVVGHVVLRTADGISYEVASDRYQASDPVRRDADGDGYFQEADPDDGSARHGPVPRGGCNPVYQSC